MRIRRRCTDLWFVEDDEALRRREEQRIRRRRLRGDDRNDGFRLRGLPQASSRRSLLQRTHPASEMAHAVRSVSLAHCLSLFQRKFYLLDLFISIFLVCRTPVTMIPRTGRSLLA